MIPENESPSEGASAVGGLNERTNPLRLETHEFSELHGVYPNKAGMLQRLPGKTTLKKFDVGVISIHPTNDASNHILIQTTDGLQLFTLDELLGRTVVTDLTPVDIDEEETMPIAIIVHKEAAGANAGASFTAYTRRKLTNILTNETGFVTNLDSVINPGQFTLAAGTYRFDIRICVSGAASNQGAVAMLYNVTAGAPAWNGLANQAGSSENISTVNYWINVFGVLTIAVPTIFEVRQKSSVAVATFGWGRASNLGEAEIYTIVRIIKSA